MPAFSKISHIASAAWWSRVLGVTHSPITDREYGSVLTFKDPDGIQLEMFYREHHP